jgi:hypothetical protein
MLDGESQRPGLGCTTPAQVEKGLVPALIGSYWSEDNILLGITQRILLQKQLEWAGDLRGGLIFFVRREPSNDRSVGDTGKKKTLLEAHFLYLFPPTVLRRLMLLREITVPAGFNDGSGRNLRSPDAGRSIPRPAC